MGRIVAPAGTVAGRAVRLWTDASRWPAGVPFQFCQVTARAVVGATIAAGAVGFSLLSIAALARRALTRQRLAARDAEWRAVGPRWNRRL